MWKKDRRMLGHFLNRKHIEDYVPSIKLVGSRLCEKWETLMAKDGLVVINNDLLSAAMDNISLIACGQDHLNSVVWRRLLHIGIPPSLDNTSMVVDGRRLERDED